MTMRANVIEAVRAGDRMVVVLDLIQGEVATRSVLGIDGSTDTWEVVGIKLPTPGLYADRRGAILRPAQNDQILKVGDILVEQ